MRELREVDWKIEVCFCNDEEEKVKWDWWKGREKSEEGVTSIQAHLHSCGIHYESNQKEGVFILIYYYKRINHVTMSWSDDLFMS